MTMYVSCTIWCMAYDDTFHNVVTKGQTVPSIRGGLKSDGVEHSNIPSNSGNFPRLVDVHHSLK